MTTKTKTQIFDEGLEKLAEKRLLGFMEFITPPTTDLEAAKLFFKTGFKSGFKEALKPKKKQKPEQLRLTG